MKYLIAISANIGFLEILSEFPVIGFKIEGVTLR